MLDTLNGRPSQKDITPLILLSQPNRVMVAIMAETYQLPKREAMLLRWEQIRVEREFGQQVDIVDGIPCYLGSADDRSASEKVRVTIIPDKQDSADIELTHRAALIRHFGALRYMRTSKSY